MATTNFNILHTKFSNMIRDAVATANLAGTDLSSADRSVYLNSAWSKYVGMAYAKYENDVFRLQALFQSMIKMSSAITTAADGIITSVLIPTDYGYFVKLSKAGIAIPKKTPAIWNSILSAVNENIAPSATSPVCLPTDTQIEILPAAVYIARLTYIIKPFSVVVVTGSGGTDIPLGEKHWHTVLALAASEYYKSAKQEQGLSDSFFQEAVMVSPFPLIDEVKK